MNEKETLTASVFAFPTRLDERPETFGPAPNRQLTQFPDTHEWEEALFEYVQTFEGIEVALSHISGDGGRRAFFIPAFNNLHGVQTQFLVDNEFAHIHEDKSRSLHAVLPPDIADMVYEKKWGEQHPLAKIGAAGSTNNLLYGARDEAETLQLKILLRISYLYAFEKW